MDVKLLEVVNGAPVVKKLASASGPKVGGQFVMTMKVVVGDMNDALRVYQETLSQLQRRYAKLLPTGDPVTDENGEIEFNDKPAFSREHDALMETPVSLPHIPRKIRLSRIADAGVALSALELASVDWLVSTDGITTFFEDEDGQ